MGIPTPSESAGRASLGSVSLLRLRQSYRACGFGLSHRTRRPDKPRSWGSGNTKCASYNAIVEVRHRGGTAWWSRTVTKASSVSCGPASTVAESRRDVLAAHAVNVRGRGLATRFPNAPSTVTRPIGAHHARGSVAAADCQAQTPVITTLSPSQRASKEDGRSNRSTRRPTCTLPIVTATVLHPFSALQLASWLHRDAR